MYVVIPETKMREVGECKMKKGSKRTKREVVEMPEEWKRCSAW